MSLVAIARLAALLIAGPGAGDAAVPAPAAAAVASPPGTPSPAAPPAPIVHVMDEKERVDLEQTDNVRLSLPTQDDLDAWASPGLRVQLGGGYGIVQGSGPALSWRSRTVILRPNIRIDRYWGLGVALLYGTGPNGLRWSATVEPTFYPWRQLAISAGIGYGGLSVNNPNASTGRLQGVNQEVSRELTAGEQLNSCVGSALSTVLRAEYLFVAGALFSSGPFVQANAQWTHCAESFGRTDAETGTPVVLTQWGQQQGATFGWWFAWR
jgi:hypothetical protein